jgi:cytosine/adenosine deaminase-related metal-dependent hydrolase
VRIDPTGAREVSLVVEHLDALATMDAARREIEDAWLAVDNGTISGIGTGTCTLRTRRRIDGRGLVALPGLVNTHHHFFQTVTRVLPIAQDVRILDWLTSNYAVWSRIDEEAVYTTARVAMAEMLLSGCTTSSDHLYAFPQACDSLSMMEAEIVAAKELGMRLHATRGAVDVSLDAGGSPPAELVEDTDEALAAMQAAVEKFNDPAPGSMVRVGLAPCSLTISSERLMVESAELARRLGVTRHTHVAEVLEEERHCAEVYGRRPVERLEDLGWLGEDVWLAHVVHANASDIGRLARSRTAVAHCPSSNMRLGSGIAPVLSMRTVGIDVGLGVDGSASNDRGSLLAEVRQAMLLSRVGCDGGRLMTAREALEMATIGGAAALRRDDIGVLAPGMRADVALYSLRGAAGAGTENDPVAAIVLAPPASATHVMVEGSFVVFDGHLVREEEPIVRAHGELVRRLKVDLPVRAQQSPMAKHLENT